MKTVNTVSQKSRREVKPIAKFIIKDTDKHHDYAYITITI